MDNKVTFGLTNVHYSKVTFGDANEVTFATPKRLFGAQEFTSDIIGGSQSVYGDDQVVATLTQNAGRTITLKLTELPDDFKVEILGYKKLENGNLIEINNAEVVTFALGLEFQGDSKARRVWFYLCTVTPISEATKSKTESVETNAISLNITSRPIEVSGKYKVNHVISSLGDSNYNTFLVNAPTIPEVVE